MTIRLHSYLKRNRFGVFYFRRVIPLDLRNRFAFGQIARSTRTCNSQEAQSLALRLSASVDLLFTKVRNMAKDPNPDPISQELIVELDFDLDGLLTSVNRLFVTCALANLYRVRQKLLRLQGETCVD